MRLPSGDSIRTFSTADNTFTRHLAMTNSGGLRGPNDLDLLCGTILRHKYSVNHPQNYSKEILAPNLIRRRSWSASSAPKLCKTSHKMAFLARFFSKHSLAALQNRVSIVLRDLGNYIWSIYKNSRENVLLAENVLLSAPQPPPNPPPPQTHPPHLTQLCIL